MGAPLVEEEAGKRFSAILRWISRATEPGSESVDRLRPLATDVMTTAAPRQMAHRGATAALKPADAVLAVFVSAAFVAVFLRWIVRQFGWGGFSATHFEDWGHAYLVPLISGWYIWTNRARLRGLSAQVCWPGLGVLLLGIVAHVNFITGFPNHMFQGFALVLALAGLLLFLLGPEIFPFLVFPVAYLGFAVTISDMVMLKVTWGLKLLASKGAWAALNLVGIDTDLSGNILRVHHGGNVIPLNVADACAGMRMVVAFVALAVAVAFLSCRQWWQRIAVILLAIPVAVAMNVGRVAVLGAASLVNPDLATGGAHMFIGTVLLVPAFLVFMACVWLMQRVEKGAAAPATGGGGVR